MPKLTRVLETALYVADLDRAATFYSDVLGLPCIHEDHRMRAYDVAAMVFCCSFRKADLFNPLKPQVDQSHRTRAAAPCTSLSRSRRMNWRNGSNI
jgi:catechol 2,3-dioxygenase-like lactoylglutathione lyase family enzyme